MMFAEDVGEYTCRATNQQGEAKTTGQILLKEKYDEWFHEEQSKITKDNKRYMLEEVNIYSAQGKISKGGKRNV